MNKTTEEQRIGKRGESKRRWDKENGWRYKTVCPGCDGLMDYRSKRCIRCMRRKGAV